MFPNPQVALPLPPRPDLAQYRKQAKDLVSACKSGPDAVRTWVTNWIETIARLQDPAVAAQLRTSSYLSPELAQFALDKLLARNPKRRTCSLADAQFVIARAHGFEGWPKFADHLTAATEGDSDVALFEEAADAVVDGDLAKLQRLLRDHPQLAHMRSSREHAAMLLHYISANGVENFRQRTPANAIDIARTLLDAGADVDAESNVYGGGSTTLELVATSIHPERAGVQNELMLLLLDRGADIEHGTHVRNRNAILMSALANGRGSAAEFIARRIELDALSAAAVGRLDVLQSYFNMQADGNGAPRDANIETGFLYACLYGHLDVVTFLLDRGVDLGARDAQGQTALHLAAIGGHARIVRALLERNAPVEAVNAWGGTVLGQTTWCVANQSRGCYDDVIVALLDAGADPRPTMYPTGNSETDGLLKRALESLLA
jgi:ankyrin repeat protein